MEHYAIRRSPVSAEFHLQVNGLFCCTRCNTEFWPVCRFPNKTHVYLGTKRSRHIRTHAESRQVISEDMSLVQVAVSLIDAAARRPQDSLEHKNALTMCGKLEVTTLSALSYQNRTAPYS